MKVIIPVAGKGTRMRPFTHTKPKPILPVAGKPIIDHIMDRVLPLKPTSVTFVTGHLKGRFEEHIRQTYPETATDFVEQSDPRGTAQAIALAKDAFDEDILIVFSDTIFDADLSIIENCPDDGIFWAQRVEDPSRFGVLVTDKNDHITKIVEKPKKFVSDLANIGVYYVKNTKLFKEGLDIALKRLDETDEEIYHVDAFNHMLGKGAKIKVVKADGWYDCGTMEETLQTNRALLDKYGGREAGPDIVPPVAIHPTAKVEGCKIGPYVTIGPHVVVRNSTLRDCIIDEHTLIEDADLHDSIIGQHVEVYDKEGKFYLGDHSVVSRE